MKNSKHHQQNGEQYSIGITVYSGDRQAAVSMIALNPKSPGGITSAMVSADELHTLAEMAEKASREAAAAQADSFVGGMIDSPFAKQCAAERAAEQKNNGGTS